MKLIKTHFKLILLSSYLFILSCDRTSKYIPSEGSINLKWNQSHDTQTISDAVIGLRWALSHIGAHNIETHKVYIKGSLLTINTNNLKFPEHTKNELKKLHSIIKKSEEYIQNDAIDLGRYLALTIGASEHYYKFVKVPKNLTELLSKYKLNAYKGKVNNSLVSLQHRIISFSNQEDFKQLFLSTEIDTSTNAILEFETIELMKNGQLKFGIFDKDGKRINAANPQKTKAGKPGKCMWCHESKITPLFTPQKSYDGFLTEKQLDDTLTIYKNKHFEKQLLLANGIDYSKLQEHTQMELLYISFMEPSAKRLSKEWNMDIKDIEKKLSKLETHKHEEFTFLGNLYHRNEVEKFAPYKSLEVSSSIREKSKKEINYLE